MTAELTSPRKARVGLRGDLNTPPVMTPLLSACG